MQSVDCLPRFIFQVLIRQKEREKKGKVGESGWWSSTCSYEQTRDKSIDRANNKNKRAAAVAVVADPPKSILFLFL